MAGPLAGRRVDPAVAQDAVRRRVEDQEPPLGVGDDDPVAHAVEDRLQDAGLLAQGQLGARQLLRVLLEALVEPADLLDLPEPRQGAAVCEARVSRGRRSRRARSRSDRVATWRVPRTPSLIIGRTIRPWMPATAAASASQRGSAIASGTTIARPSRAAMARMSPPSSGRTVRTIRPAMLPEARTARITPASRSTSEIIARS